MKDLKDHKIFSREPMLGRLPNLVIVGAMKCGTSSLHRYLNLHPQVQMSAIKELDFFITEKNWHKGEIWYRSHFVAETDIVGESSPNYTKFPAFSGVPERMHKIIPDAKLIYLVREPIQRIVSHYFHQYIDRAENRSLEEALENHHQNNYINSSKYGFQLKQFLKYYNRENFLVLTLEDLYSRRTETLQEVFKFLEIDVQFYHPDFSKVFHQSRQKRRLTDLGDTLFKFPFGGRLLNYIPNLMAQDVIKPIIEPDLKDRLTRILEDDLKEFESMLGKSLYKENSGFHTTLP